jgi:tetratricopeptide (TPR) repeat protein
MALLRLLSVGLGLAALLLLAACSGDARHARHRDNADAFFAAGQYERAEIEYLNLFKLDPRDPHALERLGVIAFEQGRLGRGLEFLVRARDLGAKRPDTRRALAFLYLAVGYRTEAWSEAAATLDLRPDDPDAPVILAEAAADAAAIDATRTRLDALPKDLRDRAPVLVAHAILDARAGRIDEARTRIDHALAADPGLAAAHTAAAALHVARGDLDAADAAYAKAASLSPPRSPRGVQYAQFKLRRGDFAGARTLLDELARRAPDALPARLRLVELDLLQSRLPEAEAGLAPLLARDPNHPEALLLAARLALARNDPAQALAHVELLLRMYPRSSQALLEQGRIHLARNDLTAAQTSFSQALTYKPDYTDALLQLASLHLRQGDRSAAIVLLRDWLKQYPGDPIPPSLQDAYLMLADAYRLQGDTVESLALYERLDRANPRDAFAILRGVVHRQRRDPVAARAAFDEALRRNPDSITALEQLVEVDLDERRHADARARIDGALVARPTDPGLHLLSGKLHLAAGRAADAETAFRQALALQPGLAQPYMFLAQMALQANDSANAEKHLEAVVARSPRDALAWFLLGVQREGRADHRAAREAYEHVLAIDPRSPAALNNLAVLLSRHLGEPERAYDHARLAREVAPHDPAIADTLGWIVHQRGDYVWALGLLREASTRRPESGDVRYHFGATQYALTDEPGARESLGAALKLAPAAPWATDARERLAVLALEREGAEDAVRTALQAHLARRPEDPVALTRLALIDERAGRSDEAIQGLRRAARSSPQAPAPPLALARILETRGERVAALEQARLARRFAPDDPRVARDLGGLAYRLRDFVWAFSLLQDAARRLPEDPVVLRAYADAAYSVGRVPETRDALAAALRRAASPDARARLSLIEAAASPESARAALPAARARLAGAPDDVAALMVVARAEPAETVAALERALGVYPDFAPAKRELALRLAEDPATARRALDLGLSAREILTDDLELARVTGEVAFRLKDYRWSAGLLDAARPTFGEDPAPWYRLGVSQMETNLVPEGKTSLEKALALGLAGEAAEDAAARLRR